jgi:hypothetical protein
LSANALLEHGMVGCVDTNFVAEHAGQDGKHRGDEAAQHR